MGNNYGLDSNNGFYYGMEVDYTFQNINGEPSQISLLLSLPWYQRQHSSGGMVDFQALLTWKKRQEVGIAKCDQVN